jgi:hypothetical protein
LILHSLDQLNNNINPTNNIKLRYQLHSLAAAYGVVLKCRNRDNNENVAIKKFKESEEDEIGEQPWGGRFEIFNQQTLTPIIKYNTNVEHPPSFQQNEPQ